MFRDLASLKDDAAYDLVVVGSGAAGLAAAVFAAVAGKRVLVVERTEYVGGTSALSGATTWIPNTQHAASVNPDDSFEKASRFLDSTVGNRSSKGLRDAFLAAGPKAVAVLEAQTDVKFRAFAAHPDYEQQGDFATMNGRAIEPLPLDGRELGRDRLRIRPPIPEFTIFGGMMVDRVDINHLLNLKTSRASFAHAARILGRYAVDRLSGPRGSRLVMGNALIGRLLLSLKKRGGEIVTKTSVKELVTAPEGVTGVVLSGEGGERRVLARHGVVLAAGGFNRGPRRAEMLHAPVPPESPSAPGHTGEAQELALKLGARLGEGNLDNCYWAPVSIRRREDGTTAVFPHFVLDRSKPGTVCVDGTGRRFVNESLSYHLFARAMFEAHKTRPTIPCFIVTDAAGLKRYGLGMVRMGGSDPTPYLEDGYLTEAATIADLAGKLGMDPAILEATIAHMNAAAESGEDDQFQRGTTAYQRHNGDASAGTANPTLGPIRTAPFYAVRLYPGDIGAATGLVVDEQARVLGEGGHPIAGLYACGNEANSIMGGVYTAPGITIGPAIAFAYLAVADALGRSGAAAQPRAA